jgi:hypothetical protein
MSLPKPSWVMWRNGCRAALATAEGLALPTRLMTRGEDFQDQVGPGPERKSKGLQHKGLLPRFYKQMRQARATDPSGLSTLRGLLGIDDLKRFQAEWESFVLRLHFP